MITHGGCPWQVQLDRGGSLLSDRVNQEAVPHHELVLRSPCVPVPWKLHPQRADDGQTHAVCLVEHAVPVGEELVAKSDGRADGGHFVGIVQPWLSPPCVQMCMSTHEGVEGTCLMSRVGERGGEREGRREGHRWE